MLYLSTYNSLDNVGYQQASKRRHHTHVYAVSLALTRVC
jgi:hypothetical protein